MIIKYNLTLILNYDRIFNMEYFITGGAGFIGSHLVDRLIGAGKITVYDNLSSGRTEFIEKHTKKPGFKFIKGDLKDIDKLKKSIKGHNFVYHLAANPDVRFGGTVKETDLDLKEGTLVTYNVLESMRVNDIKNIVFSSSSVVYGETKTMPTPEDYGPCLPISLYGASKLASEGLITAFCHNFNMKYWIFRFANIVGGRQTHGILFDFIGKLKQNKKELEILGDGRQKKSYLLVDDCIDGIIFTVNNSNEQVNVYNLGCDDNIEVSGIAKTLLEEMDLKDTKIRYTGGNRGWSGDVPGMLLDVRKINKLGWRARHNSREAICQAIKRLLDAD